MSPLVPKMAVFRWASHRARCASIWAGRQRRGSGWPLAANVTDESLVARLFVNAGVRAGARFHAEPDWPALVKRTQTT